MNISKLVSKIKRRAQNRWFAVQCGAVLSTSPIQPKRSDDLLIVSMVRHIDLIMYLIAIKSFYRYLNYGEIVVINDGTLTTKDLQILKYHVSPSQVVDINDIRPMKTPAYVSWKRLSLIVDYIRDHYVIQLDSDTMTTNEIPEVSDCVKNNNNFILGTSLGIKIETMKDFFERAKSMKKSDKVQRVAEMNLSKIPDFEQLKYIRGTGAFVGFVKNSFTRGQVEDFSQKMEDIIGSKWHEWGSEQVTVNYITANLSDIIVLPYPKYSGYYPEIEVPYERSSFLHFTGLNRFRNGFYLKTAKKFIKDQLLDSKE